MTRRPWVTIGAVVVLLGLCAVPASGLCLALTDNGFAEKGSQQRETYDAVAAAYGEGYNSPIVVIADVSQPSGSVAAVQGLAQEVSQLDGVEGVSLATPNEDGTLAFVQIRPEKSQADPATMELVAVFAPTPTTTRAVTGSPISWSPARPLSRSTSPRSSMPP